jgi:hypothetical protein
MHLQLIDMQFNYLSEEMKKQLQQQLSKYVKLDVSGTEEADEYDGETYYYPMITE